MSARVVLSMAWVVTAWGCASPQESRPIESPPVQQARMDSSGAEQTPPNTAATPIAPRNPNDRTITTSERCVLAGNCDAEIARIATSTAPADIHRRADLLGQLCDAGHLTYCSQAALDGLHDRTVAINTALARRRARLACETTHSLQDCATVAAVPNVAAQERHDRGLPPDPSDGAGDATLVMGRDANGQMQVVGVSTAPSSGMPSERPFSESQLSPHCRDAWNRCLANESAPCAIAATCFVNGSGAPLDQARAANLYRRACDRGTAAACTELGIMLLQGEGIPANPVAARAVYEQGCSGGDPRGCSEAGVMALNGEGGPADRARGMQLLQRACSVGHTHACAVVGLVAWGAARTPEERQHAADLVRDACRRGDASACTMQQRIEEAH